VPPESELLEKAQVRVEHVFGRLVIEQFVEHCHHTLHHQRIAVCFEYHVAILAVHVKPYARLAAFYQVFFNLVFRLHRGQVHAHFDQVFVFFFPICEQGKIITQVFLNFLDTRHAYLLSILMARLTPYANFSRSARSL